MVPVSCSVTFQKSSAVRHLFLLSSDLSTTCCLSMERSEFNHRLIYKETPQTTASTMEISSLEPVFLRFGRRGRAAVGPPQLFTAGCHSHEMAAADHDRPTHHGAASYRRGRIPAPQRPGHVIQPALLLHFCLNLLLYSYYFPSSSLNCEIEC